MSTKTARLNSALNTINRALTASSKNGSASKVKAGATDLSKLVEKAASAGKPLVLTSDEADDLLAALDAHPNFAKAVKNEFFRTLKNAVHSGGDAELNHRDLLDLMPFMSKTSASKTKAAVALVDTIGPGDRVTIMTPRGQQATGKAVMRGPYGWVLNMGGAHGRPGIASDDNVIKVVKGKGVRNPLSGSAPLRSLLDLKRALKAIGYGLKLKSYSEFTGSTYYRLADKKPFPSVFFGEEDLLQWKPLTDFLVENKAAIKEIGKAEGVTGLVKAAVSAAIAPRDVSKFEDQSAIEGVIMSIMNGPIGTDDPGEVPSMDTRFLWSQAKARAKAWRLGSISQSTFAKALKGLVKSRQLLLGDANGAGNRVVTLAPTTGYKVFSQIDNKYDLLGEVPGPDLGRALKQAAKLVLDPNWSGAPPKFSKWQGKIGVIRFDDSPEVVEVYPSNLAYIPQMKKGNFRTAYQMTAAADKKAAQRKVTAALYSMLPNVREVNRVIRRGVLPQTTLVNAVAEVLTRKHMSARLIDAITSALTEAFEEGDVMDVPSSVPQAA